MGAAAAIAVLPFDNPSGDAEQGYLARGFVEAMDGAMAADQTQGGGLTMRIRLQLA